METNDPDKNRSKDTFFEEDKDNDPEVTDSGWEELMRIRDKFMPYHRYIMIVGFTILIFLVIFLGFAYGGMKVCSELDGILDDKFKCHPNVTSSKITINNVGQSFIIPNIIVENE